MIMIGINLNYNYEVLVENEPNTDFSIIRQEKKSDKTM